MVKTQNNHLQSVPLVAMKPPTIGPRAGPAKGAREKIDMAIPRSLGPQMSASRAPALVKGEEAKIPERRRKIRILAVFRESAQPTWKAV